MTYLMQVLTIGSISTYRNIYVQQCNQFHYFFSLLKIYKKINKFSDVIAYFGTRSWDFKNRNVQSLWKSLDAKDKDLFFFDMSQLDWDKYFFVYTSGVRQYLLKDDPSTIPAALKRLRRFVYVTVFITCLFMWTSTLLCIF